ncbi:MAG: iron ABC transporter permease [Bauldia sp.]|nr:iron ABC transporter permease [Bauldia sp.]
MVNRSPAPAGLPPWLAGFIALPLPLIVIIVILVLISLAVGDYGLSIGEVFGGLFGGGDPTASVIVQDVRLPRTILALLIGATLGLAGAALQGLLRNPLASPYLFGAPSAAAFAAVAVIALGLTGALSSILPVAAMAGALLSVGLLVLVAGPRANLSALMLTGLAIGSIASAGTALALNLAPNPFAALEIAFWLLGSLEDRSMRHVAIVLPFVLASWVLLYWDRPAFRALTLGEDAAMSLGVDMRWVRIRVVLGVAMGVGAAVAVSGAIGFVGLVAPNLVRPLTKFDPARLLFPAALAGAALLLACDIAVRLIPSQDEIKVGILTTLIGAPFFVAMILRRQRAPGGATA